MRRLLFGLALVAWPGLAASFLSPAVAQAPSGYPYPPAAPPTQPGYPPPGDYGPPRPVERAEVAIYDGYFEPSTVLVTPGGTVRFVNRGSRTHTVTDLAGKWGSRDLPPGGSYTVTVKSLNAHFYCRHHRLTMNGTILVQDRHAITPTSNLADYLSPAGGYPGGYQGGYGYGRPPGAPGGYAVPPAGYPGAYGPRTWGSIGGYQGTRPGTLPAKAPSK